MPRRKRPPRLDASTNAAQLNITQYQDDSPEAVRARFLKELRVTGIITKAVEASGGSLTTMYRWKKELPEFGQLWDQTLAYATGDYEEIVRDLAHTAFFDADKLRAATFMLRHLDPRFRDTQGGGAQTVIVNVQVPTHTAATSIPRVDAAALDEFRALPSQASGPAAEGPVRELPQEPRTVDALPEFLQPRGHGLPAELRGLRRDGREDRGDDLAAWFSDGGHRDDGQDREVDWSALIPEGQFREMLEDDE